MKKERIASLLLFLCMYASVFAQAKFTLSGTVTDTKGEPVFAAAVAVKNTANGAYTDENGRYTLTVSSGKYVLVVSMVGYEPQEQMVEVRSNKKIDFVLKESSVNLESVQVVGKSKAQQIREGAYTVNALNVKSIINTTQNLSSIVNKTTGVRVREEGGLGSDFNLSINGMSGNSIRYFLDGIPLDAKGSGVTLANLPPNIIDRIEIYKGVVPAHLGTDALGGAVNIITNQQKKNFLDASYSIGSFHTHQANINAQYVEPKTEIMIKPTLSVNYSKNDYKVKNVEVWSEERDKYVNEARKRFHDDYFSLLGQVEVGVVNKKWADVFSVIASYSKTDKELQTGSIQSIVYGEAKRKSDSKNLSATYKKNDFFFKNLDFNSLFSYTWDHSCTVDTAFRKYDWNGNYIVTSRNEIAGDSKSIRHYKRPKMVVRAGFDYAINDNHAFNLNYLLDRLGNKRYDEVDKTFSKSNDVLAKHILGLSYNQTLFDGKMNNVFFVKDYINYLMVTQRDDYWVTGSSKVDKEATKSYWGYGAALKYSFSEKLALKASYEHSVRLPLGTELLGNGTTVLANLTLKPENSENYNLGFFGTWATDGGHLFNYEASGFIRDASDYVRLVISERDGMSQYENVSSVKIKGLEGEVSYRYKDDLRIAANCSYQDARDMNKYKEDGKVSITYKNKLPNRPWVFSNAEVDYYFRNLLKKDDKLKLGYHYQYVHWFYLTWEAYGSLDGKSKIPTQHQHNVVVSYSWDKERYNLSFGCNNMFDKALYDNFMLQKPGRSFFAKFRIFIN
jgi:outer membrane cobalamin receptor